MKPHLLLLLLVATSAFAAPDPGPKPADRPRLTDELRRSVEETAADWPKNAVAAAPGNDPATLAPVRVADTYQPIGQRPGEADPKEQVFTWDGGGTLLKHEGPQFTTELKFQFDPKHKGWDMLNISW
jgi:hypothetical protein